MWMVASSVTQWSVQYQMLLLFVSVKHPQQINWLRDEIPYLVVNQARVQGCFVVMDLVK